MKGGKSGATLAKPFFARAVKPGNFVSAFPVPFDTISILVRSAMRIFKISCLCFLMCFFSAAVFAGTPASETSSQLPKLDHFDPQMVDSSADPCTDFYQYACGKWMKANPIPADQVVWSTASPLQLWNETVLRETLEKLSTDDSKRS